MPYTDQNYNLGVYEDIIYIELAANETMDQMDIVTLSSTAGEVEKCSSTVKPFGFSAQKVTTDGIDQIALNGLITRTAKVDDVIGVYLNGGILKLSGEAGESISVNDYLYASGGKAITTATADGTIIGIAITTPDADTGLVTFKALI